MITHSSSACRAVSNWLMVAVGYDPPNRQTAPSPSSTAQLCIFRQQLARGLLQLACETQGRPGAHTGTCLQSSVGDAGSANGGLVLESAEISVRRATTMESQRHKQTP